MSPLMGGGEPLTTGVAMTQETYFLWDGVPCLGILYNPRDRCGAHPAAATRPGS